MPKALKVAQSAINRPIWSHCIPFTFLISLFLFLLLSVWPDLAKFHHFVKSFQATVKILMVYFLFGKMLSLLWQICDMIVLIVIIANGQILKNNLTIWSLCLLSHSAILSYTHTPTCFHLLIVQQTNLSLSSWAFLVL